MPTKDLCPNEVTYTDLNGFTRTFTLPSRIPAIELAISDATKKTFRDAFKKIMIDVPDQKNITIPTVKRIVYHDPATIVFWQDGTKTVVKCMDGEPFEKYAGFCAALAKKVFGSTSKAKKIAGAKKKDEVAE